MATRQQVMLERLKTGNVSHLEKFLKDAADAIRLQLSKGELTAYSKARLEAQLTAIREALADIYSKAAKRIDDDLREYAGYAGGAEGRAMEALLKQTVEVAVPSPAQIYSAAYSRPLGSGSTAKMLKPFVEGWASGSVDKVENALRLGYFQGKTNQQLTQELIGTARNKYRDGIIDATRRNGEMVVRTSMQHMAVSARDAFVQANSDIITQVEWVSTLDSRTSAQCAALDGMLFPLDSGPRPLLHIGCRSSVVPVLANKYLRETLSEGRTRASKGDNGGAQVSANLTYFEWLKGQPAAFQDEAIGKTRGILLRDGGLTSERFAELSLGKNFEPLTLYGKTVDGVYIPGMKDLEPAAFERAGL